MVNNLDNGAPAALVQVKNEGEQKPLDVYVFGCTMRQNQPHLTRLFSRQGLAQGTVEVTPDHTLLTESLDTSLSPDVIPFLQPLQQNVYHEYAWRMGKFVQIPYAGFYPVSSRVEAQELQQSGSIFQLLASASAWVRQRAIELLSLLDTQLYEQRATLLEMLHHDIDSGVRACIAYTLGHADALWAVPDLLQALLDSDEYVAETALNALGTLPQFDDALILYAVREIAAYHLPLWKLEERRNLARTARAWLKKHGKV